MPLNLDDKGGAKELALYRLGAAKEDLEAAEFNFEKGHYRASNNRAYYAIFRAISFSKEISRKISRAQEVRHASDYDDFYIVSVDDAKEQLGTAREVVDMVDKYLESVK